MIQMPHRGAVFERDAAWETAVQTFAERHVVVLPQFVDKRCSNAFCALSPKASFTTMKPRAARASFAAMTSRRPHALFRLFHMLLNSPVLFAAIQELVDCGADRFPTRKNVDERSQGTAPWRRRSAGEPQSSGRRPPPNQMPMENTARPRGLRIAAHVDAYASGVDMTAKREPSTLFAWPAGRNPRVCARRTRRTVP